ncbi:hypothetical protein [Micromonospora zamorensis]|uniref:hypothetical protein n=1 Tax=Micromonospora zamorensis TaxID=709883 RepID=UPI0033C13797
MPRDFRGYNAGKKIDGYWAVIEANAAWASGAYLADPDLVLDVVLQAASPTALVTATTDSSSDGLGRPLRIRFVNATPTS